MGTGNPFSEEMPFHSLSDYDIDIETQSSKTRIQTIMNDKGLIDFLSGNRLYHILNQPNTAPCEYYDNKCLVMPRETHPRFSIFYR